MAVYLKQSTFTTKDAQRPAVAPLTGGALAKRSRVAAVMRAQDKVTSLGRRVIGSVSLAGQASWSVPGSNPDAASQTHPLADEARVVHRLRCDVTPGCFLRLNLVYVPSGQTQIEVSAGTDYDAAGAGGNVRVDVTWYNRDGGSIATTHALATLASPRQYAAATEQPWVDVRSATALFVTPDEVVEADDLATWTEHVHAEITVSHVGGVRMVDCSVEEHTRTVVREVDDAADLWTSHMFADVEPDGDAPALPYPMERLVDSTPDGDPRGGSWHTMDVAAAQRLRLGPQLIGWSAWNESTADVTDDEIPEVTTSSATFVRLVDAVAGDYDADGPGWTLGGYARGLAENHPYWSTPNGSIPVLVAVYGACEASSAAGRVRVQASDSSWVDVEITSRTFGWWLGYGHLRCGVAPGDPSTVQAFYRMVSGSNGLRVRSLGVYRVGRFAPAEI